MISQKSKGRMMLIALVALFAFPAVIAKLVLSQGWYQSGVTNRGELVESYVTMEQLGQHTPWQNKGWQLAYVLPGDCRARCQQQLYLIQQSHIALGKYQDRVIPVVWTQDAAELPVADIPVMRMNRQVAARVVAGEVLIIDPLGQWVMKYMPEDQQDLVRLNKDILADLRKLLKLSRVG
ncbi:cytochrome oxidase biogenesis cluster protein [Vibrio sp. CAU 1672]|uniref:cytochrome oxidase biogenesis cluster protein n=1 Tax=Vibrio sp. CAU 1672 TaxID=3032594 RepID=UPI0023D989C0|nr:cytochrome oxidase biogenesis cluster protein [Vibrio sp. CAU 1672]MDF2152730.1 cytochrome oxidase biogenesis cluster protein [Vibrio sp. CAU 1672]